MVVRVCVTCNCLALIPCYQSNQQQQREVHERKEQMQFFDAKVECGVFVCVVLVFPAFSGRWRWQQKPKTAGKETHSFFTFTIFVIVEEVIVAIDELKRRPSFFASLLYSTEIIAYNYLLHRRIGNCHIKLFRSTSLL